MRPHLPRLLVGLALATAIGCTESDHQSPFAVPLPGEIPNTFDPDNPTRARRLPPLEKADLAPPPIGASTLAIRGQRALVSDSDRDRVLLIDLTTEAVVTTWPFPGAEPGRLAFDATGARAYVVLRQTGEIARLDLAASTNGAPDRATPDHRWSPCPSPRGVDVAPDGAVHVACLGGLLLAFDPDGRETSRQRLAPDLRDVAVDPQGGLWISRFRSADLYRIDPDGNTRLLSLADPERDDPGDALDSFSHTVAWRLRATDAGALVVHQRAALGEVSVETTGGYGSPDTCSPGIVAAAVTTLDRTGRVTARWTTATAVLAVDAIPLSAHQIALAAPGNRSLRTTAPLIGRDPGCASEPDPAADDRAGERQFVAVDRSEAGDLWYFSREPALLVEASGRTIPLGGARTFDSGHDLFHVDAGAGIACASCHPEGGEDGHTWVFSDTGARRTQPLHGGLKGTEPFHWSGDLDNFGALAGEVFARRMGGPTVPRALLGAWIDWIETVPMPIADLGADPAAAERGRLIFEDPTVACASCHTGARLADRDTYDVGTGEPLQTPTLRNIALRGPFMHDGCAAGLIDRFGPCGGGDAHGHVSGLDAPAIADLLAYLHTL